MLKTRVLVFLFASFGLAQYSMVRAQETKPAETTKAKSPGPVNLSTSLSDDLSSGVPLTSSVSDASADPEHDDAAEYRAEASAIQRRSPPRPSPPAREIAVEGFVSYGNWQIFAAGETEKLYTAGIEYDRNSWGHFAGAQMDYASEFLPVVLLNQPRLIDRWGHRLSKDNVLVPGLGFSPIGLRMLWRPNKAFKPYFTVKGGAVGFTQKALSPDASYYAFSLSESIGFYVRISERWDMRVGLFGDYHFSNAYITSYNPGLDVMNSSIAFSYHLGRVGTTK